MTNKKDAVRRMINNILMDFYKDDDIIMDMSDIDASVRKMLLSIHIYHKHNTNKSKNDICHVLHTLNDEVLPLIKTDPPVTTKLPIRKVKTYLLYGLSIGVAISVLLGMVTVVYGIYPELIADILVTIRGVK